MGGRKKQRSKVGDLQPNSGPSSSLHPIIAAQAGISWALPSGRQMVSQVSRVECRRRVCFVGQLPKCACAWLARSNRNRKTKNPTSRLTARLNLWPVTLCLRGTREMPFDPALASMRQAVGPIVSVLI